MSVAPSSQAIPPGARSGVMSGVLVGGVATVVSVPTIGRAGAACDVGSNAANSLGLLFLTPFIWVAAAFPWIILHGTLGRGHPRAAVTAGLAWTLWFTWFVVTWLGMPDPYPAPLCPGDVPPWWPSFLPA
jgi:hypothetical protein